MLLLPCRDITGVQHTRKIVTSGISTMSKMQIINVMFVCILFLLFARCKVHALVEEVNLHQKLFSNYSKTDTPRNSVNDRINIDIGFILKQVTSIEERNGILTTNAEVFLYWADDNFRWNRSDHGNISLISIDKTLIWSPVLTVANAATKLESLGLTIANTNLLYYGYIIWGFGHVFYTICDIDVTYFPFDSQICSLEIAFFGVSHVWMYLTVSEPETFLYVENNAWILKYAAGEAMYVWGRPIAKYTLKLERKYTFYILNLYSPVLIMIFLNTMVFVLPADSGERVGYAITCLLSLSVYMTFASEGLPDSSKPLPIITIVLLTYVILSCLICITTILGLRIHIHDKSDPPSRLFLRLFCFSGRVRCCRAKVSDSTVTDETQEPTESGSGEERREISWKDIANRFDRICFIVSNVLIVVITTTYFAIIRIYA